MIFIIIIMMVLQPIPMEADEMPIYGCKKDNDITNDKYPQNTHLCWEIASGNLYFVDSTDNTKLYHLDTSTNTLTQIDVDPSNQWGGDGKSRLKNIYRAWHDRANEIIYFGDSNNDLTWAYIWSLDYSGSETAPTITEEDTLTGEFGVNLHDIVKIGADMHVFYYEVEYNEVISEIVPDGTVYSDFSLTGCASAHLCVDEGSGATPDGNYVTFTTNFGEYVEFDVATVDMSIYDGGFVYKLDVYAYIKGNDFFRFELNTNLGFSGSKTSPVAYGWENYVYDESTNSNIFPLNQSDLDSLRIKLINEGSTFNQDLESVYIDAYIAGDRSAFLLKVKNLSDDSIDSNNMGDPSGRSEGISRCVVIGDDTYFIWQWSNENVEIWKFDQSGGTFTQMEDLGGTTELATAQQSGITYDSSDILYFVLGTGTKEVSTIVAQAAANIDDGDYITYSAISLDSEGVRSETDYYIWFDKVGDESGDPAPADKTAIWVDISAAVTDQNVSDAIESAVNDFTTITCDNAGGTTCTLTCHSNGATTNIADVDSGLSVATTTPGVDNTYYLYTYSIANDVFSKKAEFNVALMLDRNTDSTNAIPFSLEKGFGVETGVNDQFVYQIPSTNLGKLWKIADLTNDPDIGSGVIKAITDTYLIILDGSDTYLYSFQDFDSSILEPWIFHAERDYSTASIEYDSTNITWEEDMFVQIIHTFESVANQVIFEGRIMLIEDADDEAKFLKIAHLVSPALWDLMERVDKVLTSGDTDSHISQLIALMTSYITEGTLADGAALNNTRYYGGMQLRLLLTFFGAYDAGFTWYLTPTGALQYNNGTIDSTIDYTQANAHYCELAGTKTRYNKIKVYGSILTSPKIVSDYAQDEAQQLLSGEVEFEVKIPFLDTKANASTMADGLLAVLGTADDFLEIHVQDTTNGFIQPGKTITFGFAAKGISNGQYKINGIEYNYKTNTAVYYISSAEGYEVDDFRESLDQTEEEIQQLNEKVESISGNLVEYLHDDASGDIGGYLRLGTDVPDDAKATISNVITGDDQEIEQWATESGEPNISIIQSGNINLHIHAEKTAGLKDVFFYFKLYKYETDTTETEIAQSNNSEYVNGAETEYEVHALLTEDYILDTTDRLVVKIFASLHGNGNNPTLALYIDGDTAAHLTLQAPVSDIVGGKIDESTVEEYLAIGSANKRWINCPLEGASVFADFKVSRSHRNATTNNVNMLYIVDLPLIMGGKNLVITDTKIGLDDADAGDYIDRMRLEGWSDYQTFATEVDDGTNLTAIQEKVYGHANITIGGVYEKAYLVFNIISTNAEDLKVSYVQVEYYYS